MDAPDAQTSVAWIGFLGILVTQIVTYLKAKNDRIKGTEEARAKQAEADASRAAEQARRDQELRDWMASIDEKMDRHEAKLDKHNGFEGRIIALETNMCSILKIGGTE